MSDFAIQQKISLPDRYSVTADSEAVRNELALEAASIKSVTTPDDQLSAIAAIRAIKKHVDAVERTRFLLSRPLDEAKSLLIALQRDHNKPLQDEEYRLESLLAVYDEAESKRVDAALAERTSTTSREAELKAAVETAQDRIDSAKGEAELRKAVSDQITAYESLAMLHSAIMAPLPAKAKVAGAFTKQKLCWRVTDIAKLYASRPDLCHVEAKASAIQAVCVPEMPVPGLELWWTNQVIVRK